jgi:flavorubredoxin
MSEIKPGVYWVGALDPGRKLFDKLIPLPDGTSYNSYLIKGSKKTVLIDTVDPTMTQVLLKNLADLKIEKIDYVITHHGEQDHSGSLPEIIKIYPNAKVLCSEKCKPMIIDLLEIPENKIQVVKDQEEIFLGDKTLKFIYTPWVHWPETMCTLLQEDSILFSCDFFGSHLATEELFYNNETILDKAAKRYYAEIMMPFRLIVKKNLEIIKKLNVKMIAPSHGPVHKNPEFILKRYDEWTSDKVMKKVVLAYVSMHGSTEIMADYLYKKLTEKGIDVRKYELSEVDLGELASDLVDCSVILLGTPTVLTSLHPLAKHALNLVTMLRPKAKYIGVFGSFGWGSMVVDDAKKIVEKLNPQLLTPVIVKGIPKAKDLIELDKLVSEIEKVLG